MKSEKKIDTVLDELEEQSKHWFMPIIGPVKGKLLEEIVRKNKPKRVLEIGTLIGYSAILMAKNMQSGKITCLEINRDMAEKAMQNVKRAGVSDRVEIVLGDAKKTIPKLQGPFDMVFIDAAKEDYLSYLDLVEDKLRKGSIVVADNAKMFSTELKPYLDYVRKSKQYKSELHDFDFDGVEVSVRV